MANPFSRAKDTMDLVKKAKALQNELKKMEIEATTAAQTVTVIVNGEFRLVSVDIDESLLTPDKKFELEKQLVNVMGQATSKAQTVAAEQMKGIAGDLNLPGM